MVFSGGGQHPPGRDEWRVHASTDHLPRVSRALLQRRREEARAEIAYRRELLAVNHARFDAYRAELEEAQLCGDRARRLAILRRMRRLTTASRALLREIDAIMVRLGWRGPVSLEILE